MADIEKVIKGLQIERECVSRDCDRNCGQCDLVQDRDWLLSVYDDAIELLKDQHAEIEKLKNLVNYKKKLIEEYQKDQQPKKPHYSVLRYLVNGQVMMIDHPECPKCFENGFRLYEAEIEKGQKYCKRCGQAIDWSKDGEQE